MHETETKVESFCSDHEANKELELILENLTTQKKGVQRRGGVHPILAIGGWLVRSRSVLFEPGSNRLAFCGRQMMRTALYVILEYSKEGLPDEVSSWLIRNLSPMYSNPEDQLLDGVEREIARALVSLLK